MIKLIAKLMGLLGRHLFARMLSISMRAGRSQISSGPTRIKLRHLGGVLIVINVSSVLGANGLEKLKKSSTLNSSANIAFVM